MGRGDSFQLQGLDGWECIDDTSAHTNGGEGYRWVTVVNDAVISQLDAAASCTNEDGMEGITLPAGLGFGGKIDSITLTSGVVLAYKR